MTKAKRKPIKVPKVYPCPFCKSKKSRVVSVCSQERGLGYIVECDDCGANGPHAGGMATACIKWNGYVPDTGGES